LRSRHRHVDRLIDPLAQTARLDDDDNLAHAFLRGRYAVAVAAMTRVAVPLDRPPLVAAQERRTQIQNRIIERLDTLNVYDPGGPNAAPHFRRDRLTRIIDASGLGAQWPRTEKTGMYAVDKRTLADMAGISAQFESLPRLQQFLGKLRPFDFPVGPDNRSRASLFPFGTKTGRNAPRGSIFAADKGLRGFIKPGPGQAVALLDWERQELAVAGYKSGDDALLQLAKLADPYLHMGVSFNIIPRGGTADTHPEERQRCKGVVLGAYLYGMGAESIARKLRVSRSAGIAIWEQIHATYHRYWRWAAAHADWAAAGQPLKTPFGHTLSFDAYDDVVFSALTASNFPVQGTAAEIMRLTAIMATEAGIAVCAPVHDAFLIEAPIDKIESEIERMKIVMARAVELVLWPGCAIAVDHKIARHPDSCSIWQKSELFDIIIEQIGVGDLPINPRSTAGIPSYNKGAYSPSTEG
jgi:hypothetical protein